MALTKIGSIGINTGIAFAGVTTIATLNASDNVLSVGGTVNFVSDVSIGGTLTYEDVTNIDSVGIITARSNILGGSGITLSPDGNIFVTGVITATSYNGDGSNLTGIDLSAVTGATGDFSIADKIVHTGDTNTALRFPSADTVTVETGGNEVLRVTSDRDIVTQGLTDHSFNNDGSNAKVLEVSGGGGTGTYGVLNLSGNQNSSAVVGAIKFCNRENSNSSSGSNANSRRLASIDCFADTSDSNGGDDCGGYMRFVTKSDGGGGSERMRVTSSGNVEITDGDLKISTSGHGIDFSAASGSASGSSSAVLDDYEEGTWTPTLYYSGSGNATLSEALGNYVKIGRQIHVMITITCSAQGSGSGNAYIGGFPFTSGSFSGGRINGTLTYITGFSNLNSQLNIYFGGSGTYVHIFHMNSINPTSAIENVTRSNIGDNTTIRGHAIYYVD